MERRQPGRKLYIAMRARMYNRTSFFTDSLALIRHPRLNNMDCWWWSGSSICILAHNFERHSINPAREKCQ
jgi:hypothetical protein